IHQGLRMSIIVCLGAAIVIFIVYFFLFWSWGMGIKLRWSFTLAVIGIVLTINGLFLFVEIPDRIEQQYALSSLVRDTALSRFHDIDRNRDQIISLREVEDLITTKPFIPLTDGERSVLFYLQVEMLSAPNWQGLLSVRPVTVEELHDYPERVAQLRD